MSPHRSSAAPDQTIVLLGARGSGKARLLAGIAARDPRALRALSLRLPPGARIAHCSQRLLLHSHLTARENLQLAAALAGVDGWEQRLRSLLPGAPWWTDSRTTAGMLPRTELRLLALAVALLGDPQLLLIDDLARGLSQPAQRDLWRCIDDLQRREPRLILYATRDLRAAPFLHAAVWLLQDGQVRARWPAGALPPALHAVQGVAFTMKTPLEAAQLIGRLRELQQLRCSLRADGRTVDLLVQGPEPTILELADTAGPGLERSAALPAQVDLLPPGWYVQAEDGATNGSTALSPPEVAAPVTAAQGERREARVVALVAQAAWRRTFGEPVRLVWPLASHAILLSLLQVVALQTQQGAALATGGLLLQALATAPGVYLGASEASYWTRTAEMKTLFSAARGPDARRPLTLLALSDLLGARRGALLAGMGLGALAILMAHTALLHLLCIVLLWQVGAPLATAVVGLLLAPGAVALGLLRLSRRGQVEGNQWR